MCQFWHMPYKCMKNPLNNKKIVMFMNELLGSKKNIIPILAGIDVIILLLAHCSYNIVISFFHLDEVGIKNFFSWKNIFSFRYSSFSFFLILIFCIAVYDLYLIYKIRINYSMDLYNVGQKGSQRFATLEEVQKQYKAIPEKNEIYSGKPGFMVARYDDQIYIDTSPVNNLIIGMTRSGKGECLIFPLIDIYSRAEEKPSILCTDIKIDVYPKAKKTLEERGYQVLLFNLVDPTKSTLRYNPLSIIVDAYKKGDIAEAENICHSFTYSLFFGDGQPESGDAIFFANTSTDLVSASILALINDCLKEDAEKNKVRKDAFDRKKKKYISLTDEEQEQNRKEYLDELKKSPEDALWNVEAIPSDQEFVPTREGEKKINMFSLVNAFTEMGRINIGPQKTLLDFYFQLRPEMDRAKFLYSSVEVAGDRTKGNILANALSKLLIFTYKAYAELTAESSVNIEDIGFGDCPVAVFIAVPDFDHSKDFFLSIFYRQVYYILAKKASEQYNSKTKRLVKFIMDEVGNYPAIYDLDSMVTSGLGRGLSFDFAIQAYSQLKEKYGKKSDTIISNCGNKMYLLTDDLDTAKSISETLGTKTVTIANRMGSKFSLNKTFTESWEEQPLMFPNDLMKFRQGEAVLLRTMKRTDLNGDDIISYPIYLDPDKGMRLKYRYTYLTDTFPNDIGYLDVIEDDLEPIDMAKRVWNYKQVYKWLEQAKELPDNNDKPGTFRSLVTNGQIKKIIEKNGIENPIEPDMTIDQVIKIIYEIGLDEKSIQQIINLIERGQ